MRFLTLTFAAAAAISLGACATNIETAAPATAAETTPNIDDILASGGKADAWDSYAVCEYVCAVARPEGGGCWDQALCSDFCAEYAPTLRDRALVAYVECAVENPLCYQDMESCMWSRIYPEAFEQEVNVFGSGFGLANGKPVYAQFDDGEGGSPRAAQSTVADGSFTLTWNLERRAWPELVLYYVDRDEDGICTPGVDLTGSETLNVAGDWLDPSFALSVQPDQTSSSPGWECGYINGD